MTDATQEPGLDAAGMISKLDLLDRLGGLGYRAHDIINEVRSFLRAYEAHRSGAGEAVAWNGEPDMPDSIRPLSWLAEAVKELKARGPADDCEDPPAYWEMVGEVERLHTVLSSLTLTESQIGAAYRAASSVLPAHADIGAGELDRVVRAALYASPAKAGELEELRRERDEARADHEWMRDNRNKWQDATMRERRRAEASEARARRMEEALRVARFMLDDHRPAKFVIAHIEAALSDSPASAPASMNGTQGEAE